MLGLGKQVGSGESDIGGFVGDDHDLAGAGQRIDADGAEHLALGLTHVGVARPEDFIDGRHGERAEGSRADRLNAADAVDLVDADQVERGEHAIGDFTLRIRGREHGDLGATGDLGQGGRHQNRGDQRHFATRHIEAHATDRVVNLTHIGAVFVFSHPVLGQTLLVKGDDVFVSGDQRLAIGGGQAFDGCCDLGRLNAEIAGAELGAIELGGVVTHGFVTALLDVGEDRGDRVADIFGHGGAAAKFGQIRIEGFGGGLK